MYNTLDYWPRDLLNFDFIDTDVGKVSSPHFVHNFWRKMFVMLYSINWPNFIVWLPLLFEILGNMCIATVYFPACDAITFEIYLIFLAKPFFLLDRKVKTKIEISCERKKPLRQSEKHFSSVLTGSLLPRIVSDLTICL